MRGCFLANRPELQLVLHLLEKVDSELLAQNQCWFAEGTAVALRCHEYRISRHVDFLCASRDGYRRLRQLVFDNGIQAIFRSPMVIVRDVRADRYGIRFGVQVDGVPVKVEIVSEGRIDLQGCEDPTLPVCRLDDVHIVAEKLLANDDRYLDDASQGRDALDLLILEHTLGGLPDKAFELAEMAYGASVRQSWSRAIERLRQRPEKVARWIQSLKVAPEAKQIIETRLFGQTGLGDEPELTAPH